MYHLDVENGERQKWRLQIPCNGSESDSTPTADAINGFVERALRNEEPRFYRSQTPVAVENKDDAEEGVEGLRVKG